MHFAYTLPAPDAGTFHPAGLALQAAAMPDHPVLTLLAFALIGIAAAVAACMFADWDTYRAPVRAVDEYAAIIRAGERRPAYVAEPGPVYCTKSRRWRDPMTRRFVRNP